MDNGKVTVQVISHCAADNPSVEVCQAGNDKLADEIRKSEETRMRFAGFAVLPMAHPEAAAAELERTVKKHGFVGALVDHKAGDKFCDGNDYDILWQKLQELDVPIYLHPSWPTPHFFQRSYAGNYPPRAMTVVGGAMWGWHSEVGLHVLRLHAAGMFDKFPKLKIILGHFGEMIPFMLQRIIDQESVMGKRNRPFSEVWNENIWITMSGTFSIDPMRCILANTKVERIMYSVDYPFTTNEHGLEFFQDLTKSGLLTEEELELVAYKNAENLLRIKVPDLKQVNSSTKS
ncbi:hypothetical protein Z517_00289 [Fonsecaea pedrosoi CBS 271.37]|uniref:Amidohydrolase-related domain-containing protein n=1 Tax=Fonsecaea pedrosoi CBS 271.37 TaxID=1442368 RepID=A0A0D2E4A2_9EURO|nr:uncharacterized protein Z517_00289 [Fonsecaea pedrosoi CBS 271.37]KIW84901.1 hypothetical protein Z517_00289 [Fonsecaea pedrosoi CBS 271.37]